MGKGGTRLRVGRRRRLQRILALVLGGCLVGSPGVAQDGALRVHELLERISARQRSLRTLTADFVQERRSVLLAEPVISRGRFFYRAPDAVRWEYAEPDRMVVLLLGSSLYTVLPAEGSVERVHLSRRQRRLLEVMNGVRPLEELVQQFSVTLRDPGSAPRIEVILEPVHGPLERRVRTIRLVIDRELLLPVMVELERPNGDFTRIELRQVEVDTSLDPGLFDPPHPGDG